MGNEDQIPPDLIDLMAGKPVAGVDYGWLRRLHKTVQELDNHPSVRIDEFETHPPVSQFVRDTLSDGAGFPIPDAIMGFYRIVDGFELKWSGKIGGEFLPVGHIQMFGFGEVFGNWTDHLWGVTPEKFVDDEDEVDFSWEIRGIDGGGVNNFLTVMHTPETMPSFSLYFREPTTENYRLDIDFVEYLDCMLLTRGVGGWQYLFSDVDFEKDAEALELAKEATVRLGEFFPKIDLSALRTP